MVEGGHRGAGGVLQVLQKCPGSLVGVGRGLKRDLMAAGKISMGAGGRGSVGAVGGVCGCWGCLWRVGEVQEGLFGCWEFCWRCLMGAEG